MYCMAEGCAKEGEGVEEQEGQMDEGWQRQRVGDEEAECGLNSCSATCYFAVAITGSNVKLVARLSNPPQHQECTRVGNGGLKRRRKRR